MRIPGLATALLAAITVISHSGQVPGAPPDPVEDEPAGRIRIHSGYISGEEFLDMNGLEKKAYVAGLVEGMLLAPAFGAPDSNMLWFYECTRALGLRELRHILFVYIKGRDELWTNRNPAKIFRAVRAACQELVEPPASGES